MQSIVSEWQDVPALSGWVCNGSINPLIRTTQQARAACQGAEVGRDYRELVRWAEIHLSCYCGEPSVNVAMMDDAQLDAMFNKFQAARSASAWTKHAELLPGVRTAAQFLAKHGTTDCRSSCADLADLCASIKLVGSYNEFDAAKAISEFRRFNRARYYGNSNPNTGGDVFEYFTGWEGSLVIYVTCRFYCGCKVMSEDLSKFKAYTQADFKADCQRLAKATLADESDAAEESAESITWRFWWD